MGILSLLVLALFAMFNQTQKALLANVNQSDVMESGRSVMDLLERDLVRARPANIGTNYVLNNEVPPSTNLVILRTTSGLPNGVAKDLFLDGWRRSTLIDDLYYLAEQRPGSWIGAGLFVAPEDASQPDGGLGTLYRYEDSQPETLRGMGAGLRARELYRRFFEDSNYRSNNANRLIDGVIFFRVTAFGRFGEALDLTSRYQSN
ncbi:MAG TPA: hypothetical protein DCE44_01405, partial [Verrucomicrobiales bacterium]|nr:hypothetical protein [Verrucomicrobiales bacterium]